MFFELPTLYWDRLFGGGDTPAGVVCEPAHLAETKKLIDRDQRHISVDIQLDEEGVRMATQIRRYDFGELQARAGEPLNEKKQNPTWVVFEARAIRRVLQTIGEYLEATSAA